MISFVQPHCIFFPSFPYFSQLHNAKLKPFIPPLENHPHRVTFPLVSFIVSWYIQSIYVDVFVLPQIFHFSISFWSHRLSFQVLSKMKKYIRARERVQWVRYLPALYWLSFDCQYLIWLPKPIRYKPRVSFEHYQVWP